jgi:hypothetical protein
MGLPMAATLVADQTRWADGGSDDLEDEHDGRKPGDSGIRDIDGLLEQVGPPGWQSAKSGWCAMDTNEISLAVHEIKCMVEVAYRASQSLVGIEGRSTCARCHPMAPTCWTLRY